jgi:predicted nuclease of predicted toxin-antitoxin system
VRFLIDADLPRSAKALLEKYGHEGIDARDVGLKHAKDQTIARYALEHQACLITGDFGFADIRNYPPQEYQGLLVLELPRNATGTFILTLIEDFLKQSQIVNRLPGRLAVVEASRIRLRPS